MEDFLTRNRMFFVTANKLTEEHVQPEAVLFYVLSGDSGWKAPLARTFSTTLSETQHHVHGHCTSYNGSESLARRSVR